VQTAVANRDLEGLLNAVGLGIYLSKFQEDEIDFSVMSMMSEEDFDGMGLERSAIARLVAASHRSS